MKLKTSELTGKALCYSVTMLEMPHLVWGETIGLHHASDQIVVPELKEPLCYSPYMGWEQCGPIIEREKIGVVPSDDDANVWIGSVYEPEWRCNRTGPTPLIAAMRCYVASKLGDEVEIPDELFTQPHQSDNV
jgi:hypothetical protein